MTNTKNAASPQRAQNSAKNAGRRTSARPGMNKTGRVNEAAEKNNGRNSKKRTSKNTGEAKTAAKGTNIVKQNAQRNKKASSDRRKKNTPVKPVRVIPLGGLGEIGKNITVYEYGEEAVIVDCGMSFPDSDMPGVDIVIPDFTYIVKNQEKIKGLVLTHGHEDHIGGLPYLLKEANIPIYGTKLTLGLVEGKLKEHGLMGSAKLNVVSPGDIINLGCFKVEFIRVNHSIPDAVAVSIKTPAGVLVHTGDFKIDTTPIDDKIIDLARFGQLGKEGVLALLSESTNAERPGFSMSERKVGDSFSTLFKKAENRRIIVATFSSNIHRVQQIIDEAARCKRKVCISGRSMVNVVGVGIELGYLNVPKGVLIELDEMKRYPPEQIVIITTGSQGEPMSALHRMALSEHRQVTVGPNDLIIISATPIPGNEKLVSNVVNELLKLGAQVVYEKMYEVHVSGHAYQEELKLMIGLVDPKFFLPIHGEYKHLAKHIGLARSLGISEKNTIIPEIGKIIEISENGMKFAGSVQSGKVLVDGLGVGDVGSIVLRDRRHLAEDGLIVAVMTIDSASGDIIAGPDIVSRGFVYVKESETLLDDACKVAVNALDKCYNSGTRDWNGIKTKVRDDLSRFLWERTKRSPMILPIIMEV